MTLQYTFTPTKEDYLQYYTLLTSQSRLVRRMIWGWFLESLAPLVLLSLLWIVFVFMTVRLEYAGFLVIFFLMIFFLKSRSIFRIIQKKWIEMAMQSNEEKYAKFEFCSRAMRFTSTHIFVGTRYSTAILPWFSIQNILISDNGIYLFLDQFVGYFLPHRLIVDEQEWQEIVEILVEFWQEANERNQPDLLSQSECPPIEIQDSIHLRIVTTKEEKANAFARHMDFHFRDSLLIGRVLAGVNGLILGVIVVLLFDEDWNSEFLRNNFPFILMVTMYWIYPIVKRFQIHRMIWNWIDTLDRERPDFPDYQLSANSNGIWIRTNSTYIYQSWEIFERIMDDEAGLILSRSERDGTFVPKRCFQSSESFNYFRETCFRYWNQAREVNEVSSTNV